MIKRANRVYKTVGTPERRRRPDETARYSLPAYAPRGFTLLIAIIIASVTLVVGLALADIAYKQVVLSASAKQSESAFYFADSALECALYYDQKSAAFDFTTPLAGNQIQCGNNATPSTRVQVTSYSTTVSGSTRTTTFKVPCSGGGESATVTVYKVNPLSGQSCSTNGSKTCIYSNGYNTCNASDVNRFERGLKVLY